MGFGFANGKKEHISLPYILFVLSCLPVAA